MSETPPSSTRGNKKSFFSYYVPLITMAIAGPTVFSIYVVAVWSLTADLGLSKTFPWSAGPFSNWMIWLGVALLSNLVLLTSARQAFSRQ
jgi:hypothetical protein